MITKRPSNERGHANHGWLDTYHTFSFANYFDPEHTHFRALRVINEDWVDPARGFPTHPHNDMEILTYILEGELKHEDSMGNGSVIRPGQIQTMTAGTGITHSEYNPSPDNPVHLLQIWMMPEEKGLTPGYGEYTFDTEARKNNLQLIASRDGRNSSAVIHQDLSLYTTLLAPGETVEHPLAPDRHAWVQVVSGKIKLNGLDLEAGDGAAVSEEKLLTLAGQEEAEVLLFDLS